MIMKLAIYKWGRRLAFLICVTACMTGCAVKLVYNQLDWAIPWYLDDYMSLNSDQETHFKAQLSDYLYWHRVDQLPQYAVFLRQIAQQAGDGLDRRELAAMQARTEDFANTLVTQMTPHVIALFASATEPQLQQLFARFEKDNEEFRRDYVDLSERDKRKKAEEEARSFVERWVGGLTREQNSMIRHWSRQYLPMGAEMLQARQAWQQRFRDVLALRQVQPARYQLAMADLLNDRKFGRSPQFDAKFTHNNEAVVDLYQALDASLSKDQRKRLIGSLNSYADDFETLSREAEKH